MQESARVTFCRECGVELERAPASSGPTPPASPCPNCGSRSREYRLLVGGELKPTGSAVVEVVTPGGAVAGGVGPTAAVSVGPNAVVRKLVGDGFQRTVTWSKNPDCWLAEIRDADGNLVGVELAVDKEDAFLLLDEHLIPPDE